MHNLALNRRLTFDLTQVIHDMTQKSTMLPTKADAMRGPNFFPPDLLCVGTVTASVLNLVLRGKSQILKNCLK